VGAVKIDEAVRRRGDEERGRRLIQRHADLEVYKQAFTCAMRIYEESKKFPKEERFSLVDQIRRSSRSVCANLAEAWRKRRYEASFISKLSDCEAEAAETQTWIDFAAQCGYLNQVTSDELKSEYEHIIARLVRMMTNSQDWIL
jgi:four helix bundle protein